MKASFPKCSLLFWLAVLVGSLLGSLYSAKQGCPGDNILLFQNIPVDREQALLKLYVNGIGDTVVGVWSIQNCVHNTTFHNGYEDRISLDEHGNIWIRNLQDKDEGNYTIEVLTKQLKHKVELNVLVAPETRCKPKIINTEDTMRTYLDQDGCGKPAATAYWLEQPGISIEGNTIKLIPGQDVGMVYACINITALRCLNNSKPFDYCTASKGNIQNNVTDISAMTTTILVLIILVFLEIAVGIPIAFFKQQRCLEDMLKKYETSPKTDEHRALINKPNDPNEDESHKLGVASGRSELAQNASLLEI